MSISYLSWTRLGSDIKNKYLKLAFDQAEEIRIKRDTIKTDEPSIKPKKDKSAATAKPQNLAPQIPQIFTLLSHNSQLL